MPSSKRIRPVAYLWSRLIKRFSAVGPDAARPPSEGLFGYRRDHGVLRAISLSFLISYRRRCRPDSRCYHHSKRPTVGIRRR
jgi:hypothetical protein